MRKAVKFNIKLILGLLLCAVMCIAPLAACGDDGGSGSGTREISAVVISEVMSSNDIFYPAGNGNCYDWVEFHNTGDVPVDLSECYLTDDERTPRKFRLDGLVIQPQGYVCIYLSGLNGVDANGILHANFKLSSVGETLILNDKHGTVIACVTIPESLSNTSYGLAPASDPTDQQYVWFSAPTPCAANSGNFASDPADLAYESCGVIINEFMTDNSYILYDADGDYSDWIELYNPTSVDADISNYYLSDDPTACGKWSFPSGTVIPANGYLLVYCSGKNTVDANGYFHTNFSLSSDDEAVVFSTPQGLACSQIEIVDIPENISCGYPLGESQPKLFARPTPGKPNSSAAFELSARPSPDINDGVLISETLSASGGDGSCAMDYIEIHNATSGAIELGGYTLAQTPGEVVFTFPSVSLPAGGYLLVYCATTAADAALCAPMKLNMGGETLYLADASGKVVDHFETGKQYYGISSGRRGSDTSTRYYFTSPTPGYANSGTYYASYAQMPSFTVNGGYTQSGTQVGINVPAGCTVRYTTDGTEPTSASNVYTEGTAIVIEQTTVLRAIACREGYLNSQTVTATYLVEEKHSIPVVSVSGYGLSDFYNGILVTGYYNNYRQGWEREVHVEYYDEKGAVGVEFDAGASIFGQYSRSLPQKGIKLKLRETFGCNEVTYPFFPDSVSGVSTFKSLLLRPSGQDYDRAKMRDEIVPMIIRGRVDVDYQEVRACALYINGEYWGLYYIRERLDEDYLINKYGFEDGKTDLVKSQLFEQAGTMDNYIAIQNFAREHDLTIQENYDYMCENVDLESLCDFWIIETFFANPDTGNIRCYRTEGGKWRWMVYDFDWSMTQSTWKRNYIDRHVLDTKGHGSSDLFSNAIIRKMLANPDFRDLFISRYCYHINTTFASDRTLKLLDQLAAVIEDEIPRQTAKWGDPTAERWATQKEFLQRFLTEKPEMAKQQLMESFDLSQAELDEYLEKNK